MPDHSSGADGLITDRLLITPCGKKLSALIIRSDFAYSQYQKSQGQRTLCRLPLPDSGSTRLQPLANILLFPTRVTQGQNVIPSVKRTSQTLFCCGAFLLWYAITLCVSLFTGYTMPMDHGLFMPVMGILAFAALVPLYYYYCKQYDDIPLGKLPVKTTAIFCLVMLLLITAQSLFIRQENWISNQFAQMNSSTRQTSMLAVVLLVPIFEEILFRGFVLQGILLHAPQQHSAAAILTSLLFATMHRQYAHPQTFIALVLLSLLLCYARYCSAGLRLPITLHVLYNLAGVAPWIIAWPET